MKFFNTDKIPTVLGELVPRAQPPVPNPIVTLAPNLTLNKDTGMMAYAPPLPAGTASPDQPRPAPAHDDTLWKCTADVAPPEPGWYRCTTQPSKNGPQERHWNGTHWSWDFIPNKNREADRGHRGLAEVELQQPRAALALRSQDPCVMPAQRNEAARLWHLWRPLGDPRVTYCGARPMMEVPCFGTSFIDHATCANCLKHLALFRITRRLKQ